MSFINCSFLRPSDNAFGAENPDGTWSGKIGVLVRNEADIAPGPFLITGKRVEVADPSPAYNYEDIEIFAGKTSEYNNNLFSLMTTFTLEVWTVLAIFIAITGVLYYVGDYNAKLTEKFRTTVLHCLWMFIQTLFFQAPDQWRIFTMASQKVLISFWWMGIIILVNYFCGQMKASLTVMQDIEQITSLEDLAKAKQVVPFLLGKSGFYQTIKQTNVESFQAVFKRINEKGGDLPDEELFSEKTFKTIQKGKGAMIFTKLTINMRIMDVCHAVSSDSFYYAKHPVTQIPMGMFFRKGIPKGLRLEIGRRIEQLREAGILLKWTDEITAKGCENAEAKAAPQINGFRSIFVMWSMGLAVATAIFLIEYKRPKLMRSTRKGVVFLAMD